jgi:DNA-binding beta-propeller fold protein YncE
VYVSDLHGRADTVIDAKTNQRITTFELGGGAGSSQYDPASDRIFVTVDGREELAVIDPNTDQVAARYPLTGCKGSHGLLIDSDNHSVCGLRRKLEIGRLRSAKQEGDSNASRRSRP